MTQIEFPSPHRAGLGLPPPIRLMSGLLADAVMLVREGRATADAVDLAMRLGAGYPQGPLATLAALPPEQSAPFAPPAREQPLPQAEAAAAPAWDGPIGLVGTGTMAGGIAEAIARAGRRVVVLSRSEASSAAMRARIAGSLARSIEKGRFTLADGDGYLEAIATTGDGRRLADCQLVIEAVKEDLETKRRTIAALDAVLPRAIPFATNTSSFRVSDLASAAPGRALFAMHFFNPAQAMKLVELVYPAEAPAELRGTATAFVRAIGKVPVECADTRGFVVNRLLIPFLNDAVRAHEAGLPAEAIDRLMTETMGHPMGPFALIDMIGLDVMVLALEAMAESEGDPRIVPAGTFRRHIAAGRLGRKSGHGFHAYGGAP